MATRSAYGRAASGIRTCGTALVPALVPALDDLTLSTPSILKALACAFVSGVLAGGLIVWGVRSPRNVSEAASRVSVDHVDGSSPVVEGRVATSEASPSPPTIFYGSLVVRSRPEGARVLINGRAVGVTPITLRNQRIGSRAVRVVLDGYGVWTSAVRVVAYERTEVLAALHRTPTVSLALPAPDATSESSVVASNLIR